MKDGLVRHSVRLYQERSSVEQFLRGGRSRLQPPKSAGSLLDVGLGEHPDASPDRPVWIWYCCSNPPYRRASSGAKKNFKDTLRPSTFMANASTHPSELNYRVSEIRNEDRMPQNITNAGPP
jgi:hypothetical protein